MIRPFRQSSLRARLMLLVALAVLPALGLVLYAARVQQHLERRAAQENALRLARLAASNQDRLVEGARQLLTAFAQVPEIRIGNPATCSAFLARVLHQFPRYANFGVTDARGQIFCSALPIDRPVDVSARPWLQRSLAARGFAAGDYQIGTITHKATINFADAILDDAGRVERVVFVALDLSWVSQFAAQMDLSPGMTLTVVDQHGTILARHPDPEKWIGSTLPDAAIPAPGFGRTPLLGQGAEFVEAPGVDGVVRIYAIVPLGVTGGQVRAGIPTAVAYAAVHRGLVSNVTALMVAAGLALAAVWFGGGVFILKGVNRLVDATTRLASGDVGARAGRIQGPAEITHLAAAFDQMAGALQQREAQRDQALRAVHELNAELERRVADRTAQLEAANKELESFSYSVAHDLRAPLRAMDGFSRMAIEDFAPALPEEGQRYLHLIRDNAQQMGRLIDDLLTFSRLGRQAVNRQPVKTAALVRQVIADLRHEQEGREVTFVVGDLPDCSADPALLKQVFTNLLSNALKFTRRRDEPRIEVSSHIDGDQPVYTVKDNGVGFDMQYAGKLFGVFQRLHRAEDYEGTGVGLAIVQRIVHRHGGRIWAEAAVDTGATFHFTLGGAPI